MPHWGATQDRLHVLCCSESYFLWMLSPAYLEKDMRDDHSVVIVPKVIPKAGPGFKTVLGDLPRLSQ